VTADSGTRVISLVRAGASQLELAQGNTERPIVAAIDIHLAFNIYPANLLQRKCDRAGEAAGIVDCSGENDLGIDFDAKPVANGVKGPQTKDEGIKHCVHLFWNE